MKQPIGSSCYAEGKGTFGDTVGFLLRQGAFVLGDWTLLWLLFFLNSTGGLREKLTFAQAHPGNADNLLRLKRQQQVVAYIHLAATTFPS